MPHADEIVNERSLGFRKQVGDSFTGKRGLPIAEGDLLCLRARDE